jgi:DNA-binding transcriptional regulator YiaG
MTTLATALKDEIRRLARKEVKAQTAKTARAVTQYRRDIAALKRQIRSQDKQLKLLQVRTPQAAAEASGEPNNGVRFSARSAKAQRRRTGLSAADYARLVGVSALTIYNWEQGKSRPRKEQFVALIALRGIGKRQALARLEEVKGADKPAARSRRARTGRK